MPNQPVHHRRPPAALVAAGAAIAVVIAVTAGAAISHAAQARSAAAGRPGDPIRLTLTGPGRPGEDSAAAPAANRSGISNGYVLRGALPSGPRRAAVVRLGSGGAAPAAVARTLASALGLTGTPARAGADWVLRERGATLRVFGTAGHPWIYVRADAAQCPPFPLDTAPGPWGTVSCAVAVAVPAPPPAPAPAPVPDPLPNPVVQPPASVAATRLAAAPVLGAVGLEMSGAEITAGSAVAAPQVDGRTAVGIETRVEVDAHGVRTAAGWLPEPTRGADYPLVTAAAAFDALQREPRPMLACLAPGPASGPAGGAPEVAGCPIDPVTVTGAHLVLLLEWDGERQPLLVPAWAFETAPDASAGAGIVRVALDPRFLAPPTEPGSGSNPGTGTATEPGAGSAPGSGPGSSGQSASTTE